MFGSYVKELSLDVRKSYQWENLFCCHYLLQILFNETSIPS